MEERMRHTLSMNPDISVVVPVFNEADILDQTLRHLKAQNPSSRFEVIVADGHPEGTTLSAITFPGAQKILAPMGRGTQMNAGAACASGAILLFLHADTLLEAGALDKITAALADSGHAAGAFQLAIRSPDKIFRIIEYGVRIRTRITRIPYGDQAHFISKSLFDRIGGYPETSLMEDVILMRRVKKIGQKILILKTKVFTSPRRWEEEGVLYCTLRNWLLIFLFGCGVSTRVLSRFYPPRSKAPQHC